MLLANQRLPDGNQILAGMFRWRFPKIFLNVFFFCDDMELPYLYLTATNNEEFTGKSSLTSFCAESSENKIGLKHHISRTKKCRGSEDRSE